jgi:tetratricopeptide (TPR) repeat protein
LYDDAERALQEGGRIAQQVNNIEKSHFLIAMMQHKLGGLYRDQGRWVEAEENLRESLEVWVSQQNAAREAMVLNTLGSLYLVLRRFEEAEQVLTRSLEIRETQLDESGVEFVLHTLGSLYLTLRRFEEAEQVLMRSLKILDAQGNKADMLIPLRILARIYRMQGRFEEAEQLLTNILENDRELLSKGRMASLLITLGTIYQAQERFEEAEKVIQESLELSRAEGNRKQTITALKILGTLHRELRQFGDAEEVLQENLKLSRELDADLEFDALSALGSVYQASGDAQNAINVLKDILQIQEKQGSLLEIAVTLYKLGSLYFKCKYLAEAEISLRRSANLGKALGREPFLELVLHLLARLYLSQKRLDEAEIALRECLIIDWKRLGNTTRERDGIAALGRVQSVRRREIHILYYLKELYREQNRLDNAIEILKHSLKLRKDLEPANSDATVLQIMGEVYLEQGMLSDAEKVVHDSLEICNQQKYEQGKAKALRILGEIYQAQGWSENAIEMLRKSLEMGRDLADMRVHTLKVLSLLEDIYLRLNQFGKVERVLEEILQLKYERGEILRISNVYLQLGEKYQAIKAYEKSIDIFNKSIKLKNDVGDILGEAIVLRNIAKILYHNGSDMSQADNALDKSLRVYESLGYIRGKLEILRIKGGRCKARRKYYEAEKFYKDSLELSQKLGNKKEILLSWRSLREMYKRWRSDNPKKRSYLNDLIKNTLVEECKILESYLDMYRKQGYINKLADTLYELEKKYEGIKRFDAAKDRFKECLVLRKQQGNFLEEVKLLNDLGAIFYNTGEYLQALSYFQESFNLCETLNNIKMLYWPLYWLKRTFTALNAQDNMQEYCQRALRIDQNYDKICALCDQDGSAASQ